MKSQIELAKEKGIEVGDRVKVVKRVEYSDWKERWVEPEMDNMVGFEFLVQEIKETGARLAGWWFPVQSLEKVEEDTLPEVASRDADRVHISVQVSKREYFAAILYRGDVAQAVKDADALIAELNKGKEV